MVWACGKNGRVPYGQKGVEGGFEVDRGLNGWCKGGLGQQKNDGGCAKEW